MKIQCPWCKRKLKPEQQYLIMADPIYFYLCRCDKNRKSMECFLKNDKKTIDNFRLWLTLPFGALHLAWSKDAWNMWLVEKNSYYYHKLGDGKSKLTLSQAAKKLRQVRKKFRYRSKPKDPKRNEIRR